MKNIKALLKLELSYIKTYWLYVLLFFGIAVSVGAPIGHGAFFVIIATIFMVLLVVFPFEFTEKSNLNTLYGSLPTNRQSIVMARYLFFLCLMVTVLIVGFISGIVIDLTFKNTINFGLMLGSISISAGIFLVFSSLVAPFLFRFGYMKGRLFFWLIFAIIMSALFTGEILSTLEVLSDFSLLDFASKNLLVSSLASLGVGILLFITSFALSQKIYKAKDF